MKKIVYPVLNLGCGGMDLERLFREGVDVYFGTHWILAVFTLSFLAQGTYQVYRLTKPRLGQ